MSVPNIPDGDRLGLLAVIVAVVALFCLVQSVRGNEPPVARPPVASRACPMCGPKCECGPACKCDARSWLASCKAAPVRRAATLAPTYYYPPAVRYYYAPPPAYWFPPVSAGVRIGPARAEACIGGT